jgi:hypothetical protein
MFSYSHEIFLCRNKTENLAFYTFIENIVILQHYWVLAANLLSLSSAMESLTPLPLGRET